MMFPICIKNTIQRKDITFFLEKNGIETRHIMPLTNQPYIKKIFGDDVESRFPITDNINKNGFYIGCHPEMTQEDLQHIADTFDRYFTSLKKPINYLY